MSLTLRIELRNDPTCTITATYVPNKKRLAVKSISGTRLIKELYTHLADNGGLPTIDGGTPTLELFEYILKAMSQPSHQQQIRKSTIAIFGLLYANIHFGTSNVTSIRSNKPIELFFGESKTAFSFDRVEYLEVTVGS